MNKKPLKSVIIYMFTVLLLAYLATKIAKSTDYTLPEDTISGEFLVLVESVEGIDFDTEFLSSLAGASFKTSVTVPQAPRTAETGRFNPFRFDGASLQQSAPVPESVPEPVAEPAPEEIVDEPEEIVEELEPEDLLQEGEVLQR